MMPLSHVMGGTDWFVNHETRIKTQGRKQPKNISGKLCQVVVLF